MNILFYAYDGFNPNHGGIERVSNNLTKGFLALGHKVYFISWRVNEEVSQLVEQISLPNQQEICSNENIDLFTDFVVSRNIDVIICQHSYFKDFSSLPYIVKHNTGVKLLYAFHTTPNFRALYIAETSCPILPSERTFFKHYKRITRALLKKQKQKSRNKKMGQQIRFLHEIGDGVVFLSEKYIPQALEISELTRTDKFFFAGNPNTYESSEIISSEKENVLLFVGRLSAEKRPEKAMKIWQNIQHDFPDWEMKIVGDGVLMDDLLHLKNSMKLERFSLEGYHDPTSYYEKAKILLVPSDFEGFGMSILEAQQHGVVPFTFKTFDALTEVMNDNISGITVTPYDLKEFETKLTDLMKNPEKQIEMAEAGRILSEKFALSNIIKQWQVIFSRIGVNEP